MTEIVIPGFTVVILGFTVVIPEWIYRHPRPDRGSLSTPQSSFPSGLVVIPDWIGRHSRLDRESITEKVQNFLKKFCTFIFCPYICNPK